MKWSLDLAVAAGLAVAVWSGFYVLFPSDPLTAGETLFVVVVLYGLTKAAFWAWRRWGADQGKEAE